MLFSSTVFQVSTNFLRSYTILSHPFFLCKILRIFPTLAAENVRRGPETSLRRRGGGRGGSHIDMVYVFVGPRGVLTLTWYMYMYMCLSFGALFREIWYSDRGGFH